MINQVKLRTTRRWIVFIMVAFITGVAFGWPPPVEPTTIYGFVTERIIGSSGLGRSFSTRLLRYDPSGALASDQHKIIGHDGGYLYLRGGSDEAMFVEIYSGGNNGTSSVGASIVARGDPGSDNYSKVSLRYNASEGCVEVRSHAGGIGTALPLRISASDTYESQIYVGTDGCVGIRQSSPQAELDVDGDVRVTSTSVVCFGGMNDNGSWRIMRSGNNLVSQRRESGVWITKQTTTP